MFPLVDDVSEPSWGKDLDLIPPLDLESGEYDAAVTRLSGRILISQESIDDTEYPVTAQVEQVLAGQVQLEARPGLHRRRRTSPDTDRHPDRGRRGGRRGPGAGRGRREGGRSRTAGGAASHIALSPPLIGELESARDEIGRALYPDAGTIFAGLDTVRAVAAVQPIVYDSDRLWLVINREFSVEMSGQVSEAWNRYAQSMRIVGRFSLAAPMPAKSVRKLSVSGPATPGRLPRALSGPPGRDHTAHTARAPRADWPGPAPGPPEPPPAGPELEAARQRVKDLETELAKVREQGMTEQEKAIAKAREDGKAEAAQAAALVMAAAEFKVQAAGKIANPDAALAVLDLARLLKDGQPDKTAIGELVGQLAAVPAAPGHVPAGPRDPAGDGEADWVRAIGRRAGSR